MQILHNWQINFDIIPAGSSLTIVRQYKCPTFNRNRILLMVTSGPLKGFEFWTAPAELKYYCFKYRANNMLFFLSFAGEYLAAGWSVERVINAGLMPKKYQHALPQYAKYFDKLMKAENI